MALGLYHGVLCLSGGLGALPWPVLHRGAADAAEHLEPVFLPNRHTHRAPDQLITRATSLTLMLGGTKREEASRKGRLSE